MNSSHSLPANNPKKNAISSGHFLLRTNPKKNAINSGHSLLTNNPKKNAMNSSHSLLTNNPKKNAMNSGHSLLTNNPKKNAMNSDYFSLPILSRRTLRRSITLHSSPTLLCSGRRWRGLWAGRDFLGPWRAASRAGLDACQQRR